MWTYNYSNELQHYGVLGMKWGVRKNRSSKRGSTNNRKTKNNQHGSKDGLSGIGKSVAIGASVCAGVLSSGFAATGVLALTGSPIAEIVAPTLGIWGGMKYYEFVTAGAQKTTHIKDENAKN